MKSERQAGLTRLMSAYVPYCSSDVYTGTRNASAGTGNLIFHGKYIVKAIIQDLIDNTWITQAEEVVLMGFSAGAIGTESNCDMLADEHEGEVHLRQWHHLPLRHSLPGLLPPPPPVQLLPVLGRHL